MTHDKTGGSAFPGDTIERWRGMWEKEQSHNEQLIGALKAADELAVVANNTGCATQEDADKLRAKIAAYNAKRGERE